MSENKPPESKSLKRSKTNFYNGKKSLIIDTAGANAKHTPRSSAKKILLTFTGSNRRVKSMAVNKAKPKDFFKSELRSLDAVRKKSIQISNKILPSLTPINEILKFSGNRKAPRGYLADTISTKNKVVKKAREALEPSNVNVYGYQKVPAFVFNPKLTIKSSVGQMMTPRGHSYSNNTLATSFYVCRTKSKSPFKKSFLRTECSEKKTKTHKTKNQRNNLKGDLQSAFNSTFTTDTLSVSAISNRPHTSIFNGHIEDYLLGKELGKGSYAVVKLATNKHNRQKYAIKIYNKTAFLDVQKRNIVKNEVSILKKIDHENVVKLYEVIDTDSYLYLVMEYISGVSLIEIIRLETTHRIAESRAKVILFQVLRAVHYLQGKNINHRDIKLENILLIKGDAVKLIDFGFAIRCGKSAYQKLLCGTPSYMPPEIVNKEKYLPHLSDVWSVGVLLWAMLFGFFPFRGQDEDELFAKINACELVYPEEIAVSAAAKQLFAAVFKTDPQARPSPEALLKHEWFEEVRLIFP